MLNYTFLLRNIIVDKTNKWHDNYSLYSYSVLYPELFWSQYTGLGSQTQTSKCSKVLISCVSFCQRYLLQSKERYFELFRMQNSQTFPGFHPWTLLGRADSVASDSPAAQWFFSSLCSSQNRHLPKIAGYSTDIII